MPFPIDEKYIHETETEFGLEFPDKFKQPTAGADLQSASFNRGSLISFNNLLFGIENPWLRGEDCKSSSAGLLCYF
jgi:hypothetical protein